MKRITKLGMLLFGIAIAIMSCQMDDQEVTPIIEHQNNLNDPFKITLLEAEEFQENKRLKSSLQSFSKKNMETTDNKTVYSDIHGFTINTDYANYLENPEGT